MPMKLFDGSLEFDMLLAVATPAELPLKGEFPAFSTGLYSTGACGQRIAVAVTGLGPVNCALTLGSALSRVKAPLLIMTGIGGAYPSSGLTPGDLAVASEEVDADTGIEPMNAANTTIPLTLPGSGAMEVRFPAHSETAEALLAAARKVSGAALGPFVTSATVTATGERADRLSRVYGGICENMEGAAAARAAKAAGMNFAEIRGISNLAGPRDRESWKIAEALDTVRAAFGHYLAALEKPE